MITRRGFLAGLLASASLPALVRGAGACLGGAPAVAASGFYDGLRIAISAPGGPVVRTIRHAAPLAEAAGVWSFVVDRPWPVPIKPQGSDT